MKTCSVELGARLVALAAAGALAVLASTGLVRAEQPTEAAIIEALTATQTRSLSTPISAPHWQERMLIDALRRAPSRSLTMRGRQQVATMADARPHIDLEVSFGFDSAAPAPTAVPTLVTLGRALSSPRLESDVILIAGHTDAKGGDRYNEHLAQRRADAIKRFLVANFGLPADKLVAVGYGRQQLKNTSDPLAAENRRVQIVNFLVAAKADSQRK